MPRICVLDRDGTMDGHSNQPSHPCIHSSSVTYKMLIGLRLVAKGAFDPREQRDGYQSRQLWESRLVRFAYAFDVGAIWCHFSRKKTARRNRTIVSCHIQHNYAFNDF